MITLAGCGAPPKAQPKAAPPPPSKPDVTRKTIFLGEGTGDRYGGKENRQHLWTVQWKSAEMDLSRDKNSTTGNLKTVSGTIYKANRAVSTFEADTSHIDRGREILLLDGKVKVISLELKATMTCDHVRYEADKEIVKASGNVRILGASGTIDGIQEVWTTPEIKVIATPDLFRRSR